MRRSTDPAVKRSISMPASLYAKMLKRMAQFGFTSESAYIQHLTRNSVMTDAPPINAEAPAAEVRAVVKARLTELKKRRSSR